MEKYKIYIENYKRPGQPFCNNEMTISEFKSELTKKTNEIIQENNAIDSVLIKSHNIMQMLNNYDKLIVKIENYKTNDCSYIIEERNKKNIINNKKNLNKTSVIVETVSDVQTETHNVKMADIITQKETFQPMLLW